MFPGLRSLTLPTASALLLSACAPGLVTTTPAPQAPVAQVAAAVTPELAPIAAPIAAGMVQGLVAAFDQNTKLFVPVAGATVSVEGTSLTAVTDAAGKYALVGVQAGGHTLSVSRDGYATTSSQILANGVMGLANVNMALTKSVYAVQQLAAAHDITYSGVVSDPRGCAVPNAKVFATTSGNGNINAVGADTTLDNASTRGGHAAVTTATGFYSFTLVGATGPSEVRITANGKTQGSLDLEKSSAVLHFDTNGGNHGIVQNVQLDQFRKAAQPSSTTSFVPGNQCTLTVTSGLSRWADEFYIRINSGAQTWDVLASSINIPVAGSGNGTVTFRMPVLVPNGTVTAQIVQLGLSNAAGLSPASTAISTVNFQLADFTAAVTNGTATLVDTLAQAPINTAQFITGDTARYTLPLGNSNASVAINTRVEFNVSAGTIVAGTGVTFNGVAVPAGNITQLGNTIKINNVLLPVSSSNLPLVVNLSSAVGGGDGADYPISAVNIFEASTPLFTKALPTANLAGVLTNRVFNLNVGWTIAKTFEDDAGAVAGTGVVKLTLTPPSANGPLAAFRITDTTDTNINAPGNPFVAGNAAGANPFVLPNPQVGDNTSRTLRLVIDGVTRTVPQITSAMTLAEFQGNVDFAAGVGDPVAGAGIVTVSVDAVTNAVIFTRNSAATTSSIGVVSQAGGSGANALAALNLPVGGLATVAGTGGITVNLTGATAAQGATAWTIVPLTANTVVGGVNLTPASTGGQAVNGDAVIGFEIKPPAALGIARNTPIDIRYRVVRVGAGTIQLGGVNNSVTTVPFFSLIDPFAIFAAPGAPFTRNVNDAQSANF